MSDDPAPPGERDDTTDLEHLRLLSAFYHVLSGLSALCALFPVIHLAVGIAIVTDAFPRPRQQQAGPPPELMGWLFIAVAGAAIVLGWAYSVGLFVAARMLRRQRRYTFCLVMAGVACLHQPLGTVLGVFTIIVLVRPGVKELFARNVPPAEPDPDADPDGRAGRWD